jgi:hypothetical protein
VSRSESSQLHKTESHKSAFSRRILELPLREAERTDVYSNQHHTKIKKEETIQCAFYGNGMYVDIFFSSQQNPLCKIYFDVVC